MDTCVDLSNHSPLSDNNLCIVMLKFKNYMAQKVNTDHMTCRVSVKGLNPDANTFITPFESSSRRGTLNLYEDIFSL